jgi:hypothetical protein
VLRVANDGDLAAIEIASPVSPFVIEVASQSDNHGWMFGFDGETGQFHRHNGVFIRTSGVNDSYGYHTHEGESGSPVINSRGELQGIAWGTRIGANESPAVGLVKLRSFLATETCFRFFRRQPRQISVNVNGPTPSQGDPIPAVPTPPLASAPSPIVPAPTTTVTTPVVSVAPAFDATAILQRLGAVEQLAAQNAAGLLKPINFLGSDGSFQAANLGDTVKLKIPVPTPPAPTK